MEFEWNFFPGFTTLQLCNKVQELLLRSTVTPENSLDGLSSCRCSRTSHGDLKTLKKKANQVLNSFLSVRRDLEQDNGHSSDLNQKRSGALLVKTVHKEIGTELQSKWCWHLKKANTQFSDPRVHYPEECSKAKVVESCPYTDAPTQ